MADAVGIITTAVELAHKIKEAVDTVRQNREDCVHIKRRVERVRHTLSLCEGNAGLMESPAVRAAVEALAEVLGDALELVTSCQEETSAVCLCYSAGKLSKQLSKVDRGITDGHCEATLAILVYHISKQADDGAGAPVHRPLRRPRRRAPGAQVRFIGRPVAHQPERASAVPKFGDWDEEDPSTGEGLTHRFKKVREEKQSSHAEEPHYNRGDKYESSTEEIQQPLVVDETPDQTPQSWYAELSLVPSEVRTPSEGSGHGGGSPSEGEEDDYGDDGALLQEIARVTLAIRIAVETVRRNKDECVQIDKIASRVSLTLRQLEHTETTKDTVVRRVFKRLLKTFRRAHELVVACQRRSIAVLCSHGKLSNDLHWVLDYLMRDINTLIDVLSGED